MSRMKPWVSPIQVMVRGESMSEVRGQRSIGQGYLREGEAPAEPQFQDLRLGGSLALPENAQDFLMEYAVAGQHVGAVDGGLSIPVGEATAGFLHNRFDGSHVPHVDPVLHHQFPRSLSDQEEAVEITEAALPLHPL